MSSTETRPSAEAYKVARTGFSGVSKLPRRSRGGGRKTVGVAIGPSASSSAVDRRRASLQPAAAKSGVFQPGSSRVRTCHEVPLTISRPLPSGVSSTSLAHSVAGPPALRRTRAASTFVPARRSGATRCSSAVRAPLFQAPRPALVPLTKSSYSSAAATSTAALSSAAAKSWNVVRIHSWASCSPAVSQVVPARSGSRRFAASGASWPIHCADQSCCPGPRAKCAGALQDEAAPSWSKTRTFHHRCVKGATPSQSTGAKGSAERTLPESRTSPWSRASASSERATSTW